MNVEKIVFALKFKVRQLRFSWNKTQEEFSNLLGLSQATVAKLEKGKYKSIPEHETLIPIAEALNVSYWQFIKDLEEYEGSGREFLNFDSFEPMSKYRIIAGVTQTEDFNDCFDILQAAVKRSKELLYQIKELKND